NNPIPAKETRWGSFNELREFNANAVKRILLDAQNDKNAPEGSIERRVADFYTSAMDSVAIEAAGIQPISADLDRINKITDLQGIIHEAAVQRTYGAGSPLFSFFVGQDRRNVEKNMPQLGQGG